MFKHQDKIYLPVMITSFILISCSVIVKNNQVLNNIEP